MWETWVWSLGREDPPGEGNGNPLQYSCLENPLDGWRCLVGDSPWSPKQSDTTERLHFHFHTVHEVLQARTLEWVAFPIYRGFFPTQGVNPGLLHCRQIFLPAEPQGKPKNTRVDSLSLLQQIFLTQELKQGLLNCRLILYQLIYQGSPTRTYFIAWGALLSIL